MAVSPASATTPHRSKRIGELLTDAAGNPLLNSASSFDAKGRALLNIELPDDYPAAKRTALLNVVAQGIGNRRLGARLQDAADALAGPQSAPDPLLDRPAIERGVAHFFAGMAGATPQFVQEGGQRVANWLYEKQTGQKIDTTQRPIQRSTAAVVGPAKGAGEKVAQTAGGVIAAGAEIVTMRRLPFLASAPNASAGAQFLRGAATMGAFNALAPAENWKERAVSTVVGGALGGATELLPVAAYKYILQKAVRDGLEPGFAATAQQTIRALDAAATPEEQAAAQQAAARLMPQVQAGYARAAASAPTAAKVAAGAAHVGGATAFGVVAPVAEYWMNRATGSDVEFPSIEDMALSTGAMLASGFAGDIARRATEGGRRGAPTDALARRGPSAQAGPNGPAAPAPSESVENGGLRPMRMPRPGTDMPWTFPKPGTPDAAARPGWADPKITGDGKSPGSLRGADAAVRKLGDEPMPTVGGRTPRESFNYYFNQAIQTFAAERGVHPEALTADEVSHALWRAVARAKGDVTLHRTMTLPPIDPADPKAGHRLEWRRKATEYANQLLAGKEVDIDLPEPGKPGSSARGRAVVLRVEMDPSLRKGAVRVLVQDNGRLVPLAFDSMADFQSTMRVVPEGRPQGEQGRLTTSRIVRRPMPEPTAEGNALAAAAMQGRTVEPPAAPRLLTEQSQSTLDAEGMLKKGTEFSARARELSEAFRLPGKAQTVDRRASNALLREMEAHGVKVTRGELATLRQEARAGAGQIPEFDRENWVAKRYASLLARKIEGRFGERSRAIGRRGGAPGAGAQPVGPAEPGRAIQLPAGSQPPAAGGVPASAPTQTPAPEGGQPAAPVPTSVAPAEPAPPSAAPEVKAQKPKVIKSEGAPEWLKERRRQEGYPDDAIHTPFEAERDADVIRTDPDLLAIDKADPEAQVMKRALEGKLGFKEFKERLAKLHDAPPEPPADEPPAAPEPPADEPTPTEPTPPTRRSHSDILNEMEAMRDRKPRPLAKMFGSKGPTPEQKAKYDADVRAWNRDYSRLRREQRIALERENAEFHARKKQGSSTPPPDDAPGATPAVVPPTPPAPSAPEAPAASERSAEPPADPEAEARSWKRVKNGDVVSGMTVTGPVPNTGSIASSFEAYETLPGLYEVPTEGWKQSDVREVVSAKKITELVAALGAPDSEIKPLIVGIDKNGPHIVEGSHRIEAILRLGKKSFPAMVVLDREALPDAATKAERGLTGVLPAEAFAAYRPTNEPARPQLGYWSPEINKELGSVWTNGQLAIKRSALLDQKKASDFAPEWDTRPDKGMQYPRIEQVWPKDTDMELKPLGVIGGKDQNNRELPQLVLRSDDGSRTTAITPMYYNMLRKYLGDDITFHQSSNKLSALEVRREGNPVGIIMPVMMSRYDQDADAMRAQVASYSGVPKGATPSFYQLAPSLIPAFSGDGHLKVTHGNALGKMVEKYPNLLNEEAQRDMAAAIARFELPANEVAWFTKQWVDDILGDGAYQHEAIAKKVEALYPREWARALGELALHEAQVVDHANAILAEVVKSVQPDKKKAAEIVKRTLKGAQREKNGPSEKIPAPQRAIVQDVYDKLFKVGQVARAERDAYRIACNQSIGENGASVSSKLTAIAKRVNDALGKFARGPMGGGFGALDPLIGWMVERAKENTKKALERAARKAGQKARTVYTKVGDRVVRKDIAPIDPASENGMYRAAAVNRGAPMGDFVVFPPKLRDHFMRMRAEEASGPELDKWLFQIVGPEFVKNVQQFYPEASLATEALETLDEPERTSKEWPEWNTRNTPEVRAFREKWGKELRAVRKYLDTLFQWVNEAHDDAGLPPMKYRSNYLTHLLNGTAEWKSDSLIDFFHDRKLDAEERREVNRRFASHRQGDENYQRDFWTAVLAYSNWAATYPARIRFLARAKEWLSSEEAMYDIERGMAVKEAVRRWCFPADGKFSQDMNDSVRKLTFAKLGGGVSPLDSIEQAAEYSGVPLEELKARQEAEGKDLRFVYVRPGADVYFTEANKPWEKLGGKTAHGAQVYVGTSGHAYGLGNAKLVPALEAALDAQMKLRVRVAELMGKPLTKEDVIAEYLKQREKLNRTSFKPGTAVVSFIGHRLALSMVGLSVGTTAINMTGLLTHVYTYYGLRHTLGGMRRYGKVAKRALIRATADYLHAHGKLSDATHKRMLEAAPYTPDELMMEAARLNQGFAQNLDEHLEMLEKGYHGIDVQIARGAVNWMMAAETVIRGLSVQIAIDKALAEGRDWGRIQREVEATTKNEIELLRAVRGTMAEPNSVATSIAFDEYFTNFYYDRAGQFSGMSDAWYKTWLGMFSTFPWSTLAHREANPLISIAHTARAGVRGALGMGEGKPRTMKGTSGSSIYQVPRYGAKEPFGEPNGTAGFFSRGGASHWDREWTKRYIRQLGVTGALAGASAYLGANFMLGFTPYLALLAMYMLKWGLGDSDKLEKLVRDAESGVAIRASSGLSVGGPVMASAAKHIRGNSTPSLLGGVGDFAHDMGTRILIGGLYRPLTGMLELNPEFFDTDQLRWTYDFMNVKSAYYGMPLQLKAQHVLKFPDVSASTLEEYREPVHEPERESNRSLRDRGGRGHGRGGR